MRPAAFPTIDVRVVAAAWTRALSSAPAVCRKAARAAFDRGAKSGLKRRAAGAEISIALVSDAAIRRLNGVYRAKDKATNVLSFPGGGGNGCGEGAGILLGDVVIAYGTVAREAKEARKSLKDHLSHMVVHGVLHLLGYDHESRPDAETMERLEIKILSQLGVTDPYRAPASHASRRLRQGARRPL